MKKKITLSAAARPFVHGVAEMQKDLDFVLDDSGILVDWKEADGLHLCFDGETAVISCREKPHFFRLLTILLDRMDGGAFEVSETAYFRKSGAMFDCSRNAVPTVPALRSMLRCMARMGLNLAMLYTEETYELPDHPYFGYLRGRYSQEELRALDDYADQFGIEMIPCIQTLAHLEQYLRWPAAAPLADTANVLLCGDEDVLKFVEECIVAASAPFRSKRIHLGMDEAMGIGTGRYLKKNGCRPALDILRDHLAKVSEICEKHGLEPMIWSDMCLRPLSPTDDYYDFSGNMLPVTPELAHSVPENMNLIYWDYYHHSEKEYLAMIERHQLYPNRLIFAGGSWNWSGPAPAFGKTFDTSEKALAACRAKGVQEVFCTVWGDNGAESSMVNSLLGLQFYAENTYAEHPDNEAIFDAFRRCCSGSGQDFYDLRLLDELPGVPEFNKITVTPCKQALYQDVLMGMFDKHFEAQSRVYGSMNEWYARRRDALHEAVGRNPGYAWLFRLYEVMADILSEKCEIGIRIHRAYADGDRVEMQKCIRVLEGLVPKYDELMLRWEEAWMAVNKPFGFDVICTRLGGVRTRIDYASLRLTDWVQAKVNRLPELEEELLFFDGREEELRYGSPLLCCCQWSRIATACPI